VTVVVLGRNSAGGTGWEGLRGWAGAG